MLQENWPLLVTWAVTQGCVFIGRLDTISPLVSLLYLLLVSMLNAALLLLLMVRVPNFRPRFTLFNKFSAFVGMVLPLCVMFFISVEQSLILAGVFLFFLIFFVFTAPEKDWGGIYQSILFHQLRKYLLLLVASQDKFWRPALLLMDVRPPRNVFAFDDWEQGSCPPSAPSARVCHPRTVDTRSIVPSSPFGPSARARPPWLRSSKPSARVTVAAAVTSVLLRLLLPASAVHVRLARGQSAGCVWRGRRYAEQLPLLQHHQERRPLHCG